MSIDEIKDRIRKSISSKLGGRSNSLSSTMDFKQLNEEEIKLKLRLAERAKERGEANQPGPRSQQLDDIESEIINAIVAQKDYTHQGYLQTQQTYGERARSLGLQSKLLAMNAATTSAETDFIAKVHDGDDWIKQNRDKVIEVNSEYDRFRTEHRITWSARLPFSRYLNVAVLVLILAVEGAANGYFFSKGSQYGLVGGVIQAILFAAINILVSVFFGWGILGNAIHRHPVRKALGWLGVIAYAFFVIGFNLLVAHYRDALGGDEPETAAVVAIQSLISQPTHIADLESLGLFVVGVLFSIFAAIDGWKFDEPYPGYGALAKRRQEILDEYASFKQELMDDLTEIKERAEKVISTAARDIEVRKGEYYKILERSRNFANEYNAHLDHLEQTANTLLMFYRQENSKTRTGKPPARFEQRWHLERPAIDFQATPIDAISREIEEAIREAFSQVPRYTERLMKAYQTAIFTYRRIEQLIEGGTANG